MLFYNNGKSKLANVATFNRKSSKKDQSTFPELWKLTTGFHQLCNVYSKMYLNPSINDILCGALLVLFQNPKTQCCSRLENHQPDSSWKRESSVWPPPKPHSRELSLLYLPWLHGSVENRTNKMALVLSR